MGVGLLPFGDSYGFPYSQWKNKIKEWFEKVTLNVMTGIGATELALWVLSHSGPITFGLALLGYYLYKLVTLRANWNSIESLQISVISTITSLFVSIWAGISELIPFVFHAIIEGAAAVKSLTWGFLCKLIMVPINIYLLIITCVRLASLGGIRMDDWRSPKNENQNNLEPTFLCCFFCFYNMGFLMRSIFTL